MVEDDELFPYNIDYDQVIKSTRLMEATRDVARIVKRTPYISPGDYFLDLPHAFLEEYLEVADSEEHERFCDLPLIAEMLARAEGLDAAMSDEEACQRTKMLIGMIAVEGLYRKGLVKAHHKNFSFGDDMNSQIIAERV